MRDNETLVLCETHYEENNERRPLLHDQCGNIDDRSLKLPEVNINRRLYYQDILKEDAEYRARNLSLKRTVRKIVRNCAFGDCIRNSVPIIKWLPKYSIKDFLLSDIIAGCTTAIMHIPQGMGYALLAEAPPIMGLYMAFFPVLLYVLLGNSPHVSMGTFAVACLMSGKVVQEHANKPTENGMIYSPIEVLTALSFMVGLFQLIMWILRLGAIASLLSEPMVSGFTTGASFHVCASQLKDLFGLKLPPLSSNFKVINTVTEIVKNLMNTNLVALLISFITCFLLALNNERLKPWVSKRSRLPVPAELIAIVAGTLVSNLLNLHEQYNISLVGHIPTGLPVPTVPHFELFGDILVDGFTHTMVTYTITLSMGLIFASREKYEIDANQELLAMGSSNIFGSFFSCAPMCASLSRSYIQYTVGCKTLMTSVVCAVLILLVLLWIGPLFEFLPRCVLASIVVVSLKGLFMQVFDLVKFSKLSKVDACVWLVTFVITVVINIDIGLCAGLVASIGSLFFRSQTAYVCLMGRVMKTDIYLDVKRYRAAREIPGIKIFHYCGGLNFASKDLFRSKLFRKIHHQYRFQHNIVQHNAEPNNQQDKNFIVTKSDSFDWDPNTSVKLQCVIFDASGVSYVDVPGIRMLVFVQNELAALDVTMLLAGVSDPIREMIEKFNSLEKDKLNVLVFPTIHDAVLYFKTLDSTSTSPHSLLKL